MMNLSVVCSDQVVGEQLAKALREAGALDVEVQWRSADVGVDTGAATTASAGASASASTSARRTTKAKKNDRFIFIVQSPQEKLAAALPNESADHAFAKELTDWYESQSKLLAEFEGQRGNAILVTQTQATYEVTQLINRINLTWRSNLSESVHESAGSAKSTEAVNDKPLVGYLAQGLIAQTPKLKQLASRIERLVGFTPHAVSAVDAMQAYRQGNLKHTSGLQKAHQQHETLNTDLKAEIEALQQLNQDLDARLKDATEEGELILLQLHQVQEELENYFLKYKDADNRHETLAQRWRQLLLRYPDYVVYESVGVEVLDESDEPNHLQWHFKGLESAGVSRRQVVFETFIEAGLLGVRFKKTHPELASNSDNQSNSSHNESWHKQSMAGDDESVTIGLTRWPAVAQHLDQIDCIPAGKAEVKVLRAMVLRDLSASDWALLKLVPKLVIQALEERPRGGVDAQEVCAAARRLEEALDRLPKGLRHDGLRLKSHQTNPDYEHLWFVFENLIMGDRVWPTFEIRLGASNVGPHASPKAGSLNDATTNFTQHPKIEIPLIGGQTKPFEGWFEESNDDFGAKWELRFDLKKQIFDAGVWNDLAPAEQFLVKGLVGQLSQGLLQTVESDLKRGNASQWQRVFGQCVALLK